MSYPDLRLVGAKLCEDTFTLQCAGNEAFNGSVQDMVKWVRGSCYQQLLGFFKRPVLCDHNLFRSIVFQLSHPS
jgi:hypothetical protein